MAKKFNTLVRRTILKRHYDIDPREADQITEEDFLVMVKNIKDDPLLEAYRKRDAVITREQALGMEVEIMERMNEDIRLSTNDTALRGLVVKSQTTDAVGDLSDTTVPPIRQDNESDGLLMYQGDGFSVIERNGEEKIYPTGLKFMVLPYSLDQSGMIHRIGTMSPDQGRASTALIGDIPPDHPDVLSAAMELLVDVVGATIDDAEKWVYLGELRVDALVVDSFPVFAVNATGKIPDAAKQKGLNMRLLAEVTESENAFLLAAFLKLFRFFYKKEKL
jgi:hypothetical protein